MLLAIAGAPLRELSRGWWACIDQAQELYRSGPRAGFIMLTVRAILRLALYRLVTHSHHSDWI